jgi:hypothetical protein
MRYKSQPRTNKRELVGMILLISVILLILLFLAIRSLVRQQGLEPTPVPTKTVVANPSGMTPMVGSAQALANVTTVTPAPVAQGKQPPACTFPLSNITLAESIAEDYSFSAPQVVLSVSKGEIYNVIDWLPDNQQALMTHDLRNNVQNESDQLLHQTIELYNPITGKSKVYAIRHYDEALPYWQPTLNAVIYPELNYFGIDISTNQLKYTRQIWISQGSPQTVQKLADNLTQSPFAVRPDGKSLIFQSNSSISRMDNNLKSKGNLSVDLNQWDYRTLNRNQTSVTFEMAWQPGTASVFLYSDGSVRFGGGYTYILNTDTGSVCELNLNGWAIKAHWSSDGRYLAIIRSNISAEAVDSTELEILDSITGTIVKVEVTPNAVVGEHSVDDFVWAPDNHHLVAFGSVFPSQDPSQHNLIRPGLYLVDFISNQSNQLFSDYSSFFSDALPWNNLAWSPDGSKLLIRCPTNEIDRFCLISVSAKQH